MPTSAKKGCWLLVVIPVLTFVGWLAGRLVGGIVTADDPRYQSFRCGHNLGDYAMSGAMLGLAVGMIFRWFAK